ncbi:MAG: sulfur carrier protein ThiS, partial [Pyrinomonadaceae bacterium]
MIVRVNGEECDFEDQITLDILVKSLSLVPEQIAIQHNLQVVKRAEWLSRVVVEGDQIEIVHFVGGGSDMTETKTATELKRTTNMVIGDREFNSRLIIGTGKYRSYDEMKAAHKASGAEMVTVAVRRVPLDHRYESFLDHLDPSLVILPNTAGC